MGQHTPFDAATRIVFQSITQTAGSFLILSHVSTIVLLLYWSLDWMYTIFKNTPIRSPPYFTRFGNSYAIKFVETERGMWRKNDVVKLRCRRESADDKSIFIFLSGFFKLLSLCKLQLTSVQNCNLQGNFHLCFKIWTRLTSPIPSVTCSTSKCISCRCPREKSKSRSPSFMEKSRSLKDYLWTVRSRWPTTASSYSPSKANSTSLWGI